MSRLLHLSLWLDGAALGRAELRGVLEAVRRRSQTGEEAVFRELEVRDRDRKNVVAASPLETSEVAAVLAALPDDFSPSLAIEVGCTYDSLRYDETSRTLAHQKRRLEVDVCGPEYGWRGLYFKTFGPLQLSWYSTKNFAIPVELVAAARESGGAFLSMIARLRENYGGVLSLARDLIAALDPRHLLIYTEADLHPLTAHTIYHRDVADFGRDLDRIVALHRSGGVYFTDVTPDDPAFAPPRGPSRNYGYLRSELGPERADEIAERIDAAADQYAPASLPPEVIVDTLMDSASTDAERIGEGLLLTSKDAPFDYVEEPYVLLFDAASQTVH